MKTLKNIETTNQMRKLTLIIAISLVSVFYVGAQSKSDKMYDTFSGKDGISNFSFSKNMIDAIDLDLGDDEDEKNVTGDLHQISFISYNPEKGNLSGSEFTKEAIALLPSAYKKLDIEEDEDTDAEIWLLGKRKKFDECHIFIKNDDQDQMRFVVSFFGDFTVNDIENLKNKGKELSSKN
jgi:hypothetical protein